MIFGTSSLYKTFLIENKTTSSFETKSIDFFNKKKYNSSQ